MTGAAGDQLEQGVALYNRGDYLGAQERFEDVVNASPAAGHSLARALLMVACGMHLHFHRGGGRGALNLFRQGLLLLEDLRPACEGVATGELYDGLYAYLQEIEARKKPGAGFFDRWLAPKIRWA